MSEGGSIGEGDDLGKGIGSFRALELGSGSGLVALEGEGFERGRLEGCAVEREFGEGHSRVDWRPRRKMGDESWIDC